MHNNVSPLGELSLSRWPVRKDDILRAWDAADEYLLDYLVAENLLLERRQILVINDGFGALSCALKDHGVTSWSDSKISHLATEHNLGSHASQPEYLTSLESPTQQYDLVLIKVPKTMALLEDQLHKLRPCITENTRIIAAGMVKHLPKSAFQWFEKTIGPVTTSLAKKKARLIFSTLDDSLNVSVNPYPSSFYEESIGLELSNHANVFSRDKLDQGARFFLKQFGQLPEAGEVIDLACGNGVLGIRYQQLHPASKLTFIDESYMAVASAEHNYSRIIDNQVVSANFSVADGLSQTNDNSADLILCNPPFHQQHVIGEQIATQFFHRAKRVLNVRGELWIVANRHLDYGKKLKRIFGNCRLVATDKKFVVLRVVKR